MWKQLKVLHYQCFCSNQGVSWSCQEAGLGGLLRCELGGSAAAARGLEPVALRETRGASWLQSSITATSASQSHQGGLTGDLTHFQKLILILNLPSKITVLTCKLFLPLNAAAQYMHLLALSLSRGWISPVVLAKDTQDKMWKLEVKWEEEAETGALYRNRDGQILQTNV